MAGSKVSEFEGLTVVRGDFESLKPGWLWVGVVDGGSLISPAVGMDSLLVGGDVIAPDNSIGLKDRVAQIGGTATGFQENGVVLDELGPEDALTPKTTCQKLISVSSIRLFRIFLMFSQRRFIRISHQKRCVTIFKWSTTDRTIFI